MRISLFSSLGASHRDEREIEWAELCAYLANPPEFPSKAAMPLLKLGAFGEQISAKGSLRHDANVLYVSGVEGDHDAGLIQPRDAAAMLQNAGIAGVIYTTPSHTPQLPRWRVLAPLAQPYQPASRWELTARLNHVFGGTLAAESFTLSQAFYYGRVAGQQYEAYQSNGYFLDALQLPATYPAARPNGNSGDLTLSSGPVPEWRGPVDDDDLIRRALMSSSVAGAFARRACFADLWNANAEALAVSYPPDKHGEAWNASEADAALASHLAFWTGRDGERIHRLMLRSGLVREKWEREDYLPRTICEMLARPGDVLQDKPIEAAAVPQASAEAPTQADVTGQTFLAPDAQKTLFAGCVYVLEHHRVLVPGGALLKPEQFRAAFGGYVFAMDAVNERTSRNAWEAFTESQVLRAPRADSVCFKPDQAPGAVIKSAGKSRANTWWPADVARVQGDAGPFLAHLARVLPDERDRVIFLSYMAACVQHKGVKFSWAPVLQGVEGNGKTLFSACVAEAIGQHYTHWPKAKDILSDFNKWLANKVFIALEELKAADQMHTEEILEALKTMITGGMGIQIQAKGVDQDSMSVCANFMITTNYKTAVRKTPDNARRFGLFFSAQQSLADIHRDGMGGDYFPRLWAWLRGGGFAIVSELLHTYQIPAGFNPVDMARAPDTSATAAAIVESRGNVEQQIAEAIAQDMPGFMGGWISSIMLDRLLTDTLRMGSRLSLAKRREMLQGMGYVLHPGLSDGRVNNPVLPDGRKPQLYILAGHPERFLQGPAEIARAYSAAQVVKPQ